jgi:membrane protease YdiL (CAAX protease family)
VTRREAALGSDRVPEAGTPATDGASSTVGRMASGRPKYRAQGSARFAPTTLRRSGSETVAPTGFDARRLIALGLPVAVPLAMTATFALTRDRYGDHVGYVAGFGAYWAICAGFSIGLLGRRRIRELFRDVRPRLGTPAVLGAVLLLWPPVGAIATRFVPEIGSATPAMVAMIVAVAVANATLEELLWRGVYITLWPRSSWLGWIWPAIGFGAWHLAPQVIHPSAMGPLVYVASATWLGMSWGWVAWRTGSLRWVSASHVLTDGSGIRNALFFLG